MEYRRDRTEGGTYFFTVVTYDRERILCMPDNVSLLKDALKHVMQQYPFKIDAFVLLPEHLHCIWTLPDGDRDFSKRWRLIKSYFSKRCHRQYRKTPSLSRQKKKEQAVWQRRFWEHQIGSEADFARHVEYIHFNPVKHGLVEAPKDWAHSSFHRYVRDGSYELDWASTILIMFDSTVGGE